MKRELVTVPILICFFFACCSKAKGPADGKSVQVNNHLDSTVSLSALINGTNWQTDSAYGYKVNSSGNDSGVVNLVITASKRNGGVASTISFNITRYSGANTYTIAPPVNTAAYYIGSERHFATSGQLVVTTDTGVALLGNFYFTADSFNVEQGVFNVARP